MSEKTKLKEIFTCPVCYNRFNDNKYIPKLIPCGKTICSNCIETKLDSKCKFCNELHKAINYPVNDILFVLMRKNPSSMDVVNVTTKEEEIKSLNTNRSEKHRKMNFILNEIETNTNELESSIFNSKEKLMSHFSQVEDDIKTRTDHIINELIEARDCLIKELNMHKKSALAYLDEGCIDENSSIQLFKKETRKNYQRLRERTLTDVLDDSEIRSIAGLAEELNNTVVRTKNYFENCIKCDLRLVKAKFQIDPSAIGRLEFKKSKLFEQSPTLNSPKSPTRPKSDCVYDLNRFKTVNYKLPLNTKNALINVLENKSIIKASEVPIIDDFSYALNLKLINSDGVIIRKTSEQIGSYRLKKLQTSSFNNYIALILVSKFDSCNFVKLYDSELNLAKEIELSYNPTDMHMNENGIYIRSSNNSSIINKYDYGLVHLKSFGQASKEADAFYIPKHLKLNNVIEDKLYFIDNEKSKIRIMNENSGKYVKTINLDDEKNSLLIQVDSNQRITIINKRQFRLSVLNWEGMLLHQKKIDPKIVSVDQFYLVKDGVYAVVDRKNHLIHFF